MGEKRLKAWRRPHGLPRADALHLATRVGPDHHVAELDVADVAPIGHIDGRGAVALVADKFGAGEPSTVCHVGQEFPPARGRPSAPACPLRANRPLPVYVELAKIFQIGFRFPSFLRVGLPTGDRPAAANHGSFLRRRPVERRCDRWFPNRLHRRQAFAQSDIRPPRSTTAMSPVMPLLIARTACRAFSIVANGWASVPGLASLPAGAT